MPTAIREPISVEAASQVMSRLQKREAMERFVDVPHTHLHASVFCCFLWNIVGRGAGRGVQIAHNTSSPAILSPHTFGLPLPHHDVAASLTLGHYWVQMSVNQPSKLLEPPPAAHANNRIQNLQEVHP